MDDESVKKLLKVAGASILVGATGGLAAPIVSAGMLGGVVLAPIITSSLSTIATIGVVKDISDAKKFKKENEALREQLRKSNMDNKAKQKIIENLNKELEQVKAELRAEQIKSSKNNQRIQLMEGQIKELMKTIETAYAA